MSETGGRDPDPTPLPWRRALWIAGGLGAFASAVVLQSVLRSIAAHSQFWTPTHLAVNVAIAGGALLGFGWSFVTILRRHRRGVLFANLGLLLLLALAPGLMELGLRTGIWLGLPLFRQPGLYADPFSDDDWYKLHSLWHPEPETRGDPELPTLGPDLELGWGYPRTPENPLGILAVLPYREEARGRPVLFFGDSFVAHGSRPEDKIPQRLDALLAGFRVYNFGVGGYGLDQIFLHFRRSHGRFERPIILLGIYVMDLDRALLRFRNAPKPFFRLEGDELVLDGVPVSQSVEEYLQEHPPGLRSYFGAALQRVVRYYRAGGSSHRDQFRRAEIEAISSRILELAMREARSQRLDLVFVTFSPPPGGGWRRDYLRAEFQRLGAPHLDAEQILAEAQTREHRPPSATFDATGHYTPWANHTIADALAAYLRRASEGGPAR